MKLTPTRRSLTASSTLASAEFTVQANAHMMEILSGLYSDIPWAVVREYSTNMLDGYTALPQEADIIPPQIHLPTALEPYIEFKDFGIGMDFDTVWRVYTTYGASTKTGNNEEVGGFGLGAKTAFCYEGCDSWTVESRFNGERMIFTATRDERGVPTLFHVATVKTAEHSGVSIRIPVAQADFSKFHKATERLIAFYPLDVQITGHKGFFSPKPEYVREGARWALHNRSTAFLVMGNVPYPLDLSRRVAYERFRREGFYHKVDIKAPVGAVDIVPSREALKYTERTIKYINEALMAFKEDQLNLLKSELEDQSTEWEAINKLALMNEHGSGLVHMTQLLGRDSIEWKGKALSLDNFDNLYLDLKGLQASYPDANVVQYRAQKESMYRHSTLDKKGICIGIAHPLKPSLSLVVLDDSSTDSVSWIRWFVENLSGRFRKVVKIKASGLTKKALAGFVRGYPYVLTISELKERYTEFTRTKTPAPIFVPKKVSFIRIPVPNQRGIQRKGEWIRWSAVDAQAVSEGFYLQPDNYGICMYSDEILYQLLEYADEHDVIPEGKEIYIVPASYEGLANKKEWQALDLVVKRHLEEYLKEHEEDFIGQEMFKIIYDYPEFSFLAGIKIEELEEDSVARKVAQLKSCGRQYQDTYDKVRRLAKSLRVSLPLVPREEARGLIERIHQAYPLFRTYFHYNSPKLNPDSDLVEYIQVMDKANREKKGAS